MRTRFLFILSACILFGLARTTAFCQKWTHYSEAEGLVGNSIWSIQEDKKGYLWLVTEFSGVSRYDGIRIENFRSLSTQDSIASDNIYCTMADRSGNFWFGTDRGVSKFDGLYFQNFDVTHGLAGNYITFIHEDKVGTIWLGTHNGVSRFDGKTFHNFDSKDGLSSNNIKYILEDRSGHIWLGTQNGITKFDGDKFRSLGIQKVSHPIQMIFEDRNRNIWLGAENGAYVIRHNSTTIEGPLINANVSFILEDQLGILWFATLKQGLCSYDFSNQYSQNYLKGKSIKSIREDNRGNLWIGTDKGIYCFDGKEFLDFSRIEGIGLGFVRSILEDGDQNLWFGTDNGVWRYTIENLQTFTEKTGLLDNSVVTALEDKEGKLWFGTRGNGVCQFDGKAFQSFDRSSGLPGPSILSMVKDCRGDIWIGCSSGVCRYDGEQFYPIKGEPALDNAVRSVVEDNVTKDLWFATGDGVVRFNGASFQPFRIANGSELIVDRTGNVWLGSWTDGLYRFDGKNWRHYTEADGIGGNQISWILETHQGDVWFGFKGDIGQNKGGVCRYDGAQFTVFTKDDGLSDDSISVALEDNKGHLWFGTEDKGLIRYDIDPSEGTPRFVSMTEAAGLISNNIASIFMDRSWNLWFGTDEGVSKYDGENFQSFPLDLTLGTVHAIFEDSKGDIWFITTNDGVIKYIHSAKEIRPRVHLTQVEADKIYHHVDKVRIPSTTKRITIEYKGISFRTRPQELRYVCQLEGFDDTWSPSTMSTRVHYERLKPGEYQFRVRAIDKDLHKTHPPASLDIVVFRPWYLTPHFFIGLILGGLAFLGGGGYLVSQLNRQRKTSARLREKLQKREEAERIQTAKMRSLRQLVAGVAHEVNNPIGVISSSSDTFKRTIPKIKQTLDQVFIAKTKEGMDLEKTLLLLEETSSANDVASKRVEKIVTNLRIFVGLDEAEWRTADLHEGLDTTISMMELGEHCQIKIVKEYGLIPKIYCSPSSLNQVFMCMLRNSCEAIGDEGEIRIETSTESGNVKITIRDTGKGISPENLGRIFDPGFTTKALVGVGLGLATCYKIIVDEHKGHIDVASELGKGTTFSILLPISGNERIEKKDAV
ncbi:MAG: two-component regulator propeller domain-containing protein [Candidatus Aminicenantes bacterium]